MSRILFLTYHLPTPGEAGAGRPWAEATMLRDNGHEVTVITAGTHYLTGKSTMPPGGRFFTTERIEGMRVAKVYAVRGFRKSMLRRLMNYISFSLLALFRGIAGRQDYVFMGTDPLFIVPVGYLLSLWHRARLVLDERDLFPDTLLAHGMMRPGMIAASIERWHNFVRRKAHHIVSATPGIKKLLVEKGISADKITVMVNCFPPEVDRDASIPVAAEWEGSPAVFYGGGMGMSNALMTIVEAARLLQERDVDVRFVFVGEGDLKATYIRHCEEQGIDNCRFLPAVTRSEMPLLIAKADICVHSLGANPFWRCALSSKVLDYLAYGKATVFAGEGDIADLLEAAEAGLSVPPEDPASLADAFQHLCEREEVRLEMGRSGQSYVLEHFSRDALRACLETPFRGG